MEKRTIGPVFVEWSENLLTVRRTNLSAWYLVLLTFCLVVTVLLWINDTVKHGWKPPEIRTVFGGLLSLPFLFNEWTLWSERLILDWTTNRVRDRNKEHGAVDDVRGAEVVAFMPQHRSKRFYAVILRRRDGTGASPTVRALTTFKREAQAQQLADVIKAFLQQPAPTETPGVWPPPPRRTERPTVPSAWKRAAKRNDDATH